jgi:Tol biopolymer transport system component
MPIAAGTRFGSYEITGSLGAGGMGEVYRATDTKLGRQVAIKTLPAALAADKDRLARFEREAKLLAALNHAHIGAIYGFDEHEGTLYIAMELIEGETLDHKLKAGPLPVEDALRLALQMAQALEAAHEKGVVHRDLKPANVMITHDGVVKVLDFGLAKAFSGNPSEASPAHSPALSVAMTQQGLLLGTAGYMSPEQASGQATDQRADIWAFGVVVYEMLTGMPLFGGESVPHVLADVLRTEPDWSRLPKNLHPRIRQMLERCLDKKPRSRYHSMADVRVDIEKALSDPRGTLIVPAEARPASTRAWPVAAAVVVTAALAGLAAWTLKPNRPERPLEPQRLSVVVPANRPVDIRGTPARALAISPDGARVAYVTFNRDEPVGQRHTQLELRTLGELAVRDLPGTTDARQPFFSPDGQWVGFFTNAGELKKVSLAGGNPLTLAQNINGARWAFAVWSDDGTIIFSATAGGLQRVSADGGAVSDLTTPDAGGNEFHTAPTLVPGRRAVLFHVTHRGGSQRIEALMLDTGERRVVVEDGRYPTVLNDGRLLFQRGESVLVAPFDTQRLALTGSAVSITDNVRADDPGRALPNAQLAVSSNGSLAYLPAEAAGDQIGLVTMDGSFQPLDVPPGSYELPRASPDGRSIAFIAQKGLKSEVRIYELARGSTLRLGQEGGIAGLAWHPDGRSMAVAARPGGISVRTLAGTEQPLLPLPSDGAFFRNMAWSPDGTRLAYTAQTGDRHDIGIVTTGDTPTASTLLGGDAREYSPRFSPDGRWLAYQSDESGRREVYLQRYPAGERLAVSAGGGGEPLFSPDGTKLYFAGADGGVPKLMAVALTPKGDGLELGKPEGLFELTHSVPAGVTEAYRPGDNGGPDYDVLPDGKRFVMIRETAQDIREIVIVQNWFEELKRLAPMK